MIQTQTQLPNDPMILLSYINTMLRDNYSNLKVLCDDLSISKDDICTKLYALGYAYDKSLNKFI